MGLMRILIIEDEPLIARALGEALVGDGYAVDHVDRGDDGLWKATETSYDAIILDLMLPGMNGFVVCRELRGRGITTPIMMLTAKDGEFDQAEGLDTGADDYVTKPFSLVVVLARLRALIRRGPAERPAALTAGDLVLDPAGRTCRRGEDEISLTPREFGLLHYLMHRAGQPVSKRDLISHVWSEEDLEDSVVQVYIGYLRRKIDDPYDRHAIETIRGFGYRLASDGG